MNYNKPLIAILIGAFVLIPLEIYTQVMKYLGLTTISSFELTSMMFMREGNWIIGGLAGPAVGALAVFVLYQLTKIIGSDYLPIKGAVIGMFTYAAIVVIFATLGRNPNMAQNVSGNLVHTSAAALGGLLAGILMRKYLLTERPAIIVANQNNEVKRYILLPGPARKHEPSKKQHGLKSKLEGLLK